MKKLSANTSLSLIGISLVVGLLIGLFIASPLETAPYLNEISDLESQITELQSYIADLEGQLESQTDNLTATFVFVGSVNSDVYHRQSCIHAQNIDYDNRIVFLSEEEAINAGYRACKICKP